ncbi:MAG: outer membrane lipoprotein carrier protein LolA [Pseudomonadota bacterium]
MILSLSALAAILSFASFPLTFQTGPALEDQRAEVFQDEPRAESTGDDVVPQADIGSLPGEANGADGELNLPAEEVLEPEFEPVPQIAEGPSEPVDHTQVDSSLVTGDARQVLLNRVSAALSSVSTAKGRFVQIAPDGSETSGDFYLRRPGRVRFEYDAPVPILIVADGATVAIEDRDLETQDRVPLGTTPLGLLLDDDLDFESDAEILSVRRANGFVAVSLRDRSGQTEGTLDIMMTDEPLALVAWQTIDAAGGITGVQLNDVETGVRLSPRLFRIEELDEDQGRD